MKTDFTFEIDKRKKDKFLMNCPYTFLGKQHKNNIGKVYVRDPLSHSPQLSLMGIFPFAPPPKKNPKNKKTAHRERDICQFHLKQFSIDEIFIKLIAEDCCLFSSNMKYLYFGHIGSPRTF